jgi:hypothetical protein
MSAMSIRLIYCKRIIPTKYENDSSWRLVCNSIDNIPHEFTYRLLRDFKCDWNSINFNSIDIQKKHCRVYGRDNENTYEYEIKNNKIVNKITEYSFDSLHYDLHSRENYEEKIDIIELTGVKGDMIKLLYKLHRDATLF